MSSEIQKVIVKDDRLNVSDSIKYAVHKGGQNVTSAQFKAVSESVSSHTYNIQVPSEQTLVDRRVLWQSTITVALTGAQPVAPASLLDNYGVSEALAPFPLHQLCTTMTATINNNSISTNMQDILPALLRFNDSRELQRYNGYTPVKYDTVGAYEGLTATNPLNPNAGILTSGDINLAPRGSWVLTKVGGALSGTEPDETSTIAGKSKIYVQFTVSEPLLMSPFIFAHPKSNNQAFYGIQNMNFVFNIDPRANRLWRASVDALNPTSAEVISFKDSQLIFNFLTPHPSDLMPARNIVPFYEMPRYITTGFGSLASGAEKDIRSQTLQLNQIPDKLIIFATKRNKSISDPDAFLVIKNISINFNNNSGLGSAFTQQDLYRYSVENGSNQSWYEFSGYGNTSGTVASGNVKVPNKQVMAGSLLCLEFGKDIQLTEDYYASGSLGNFNLQVNLRVMNQFASAVDYDLYMITMNSGVFVCERGTSTTYTGILTKQDVLDASASGESYSRSDVERLVGGGFLDSLKSIAGKALPYLPSIAKQGLKMLDNKYAKAGVAGLESLGYGKSIDRRIAK